MNPDREIYSEQMGLRGLVQTVKTEGFRFTVEGSNPAEELEFISTVTFDQLGYTLEKTQFYAWSPESSTKTIYIYDTAGKLTELSVSYLNGDPGKKTRFVYDGEDRLLEVSYYRPSGALTKKLVFAYHHNGKKAEERFYHFKEQRPGLDRFINDIDIFHYFFDEINSGYIVPGAQQVKTLYDLEGKASELQFLSKGVMMLSKIIITRDEAGRITKHTRYDTQKFPTGIPVGIELPPNLASFVSELVYDKKGRVVEDRMYVGNVFSSRSVYAYDAKGEKIADTTYEADGTLKTQYRYEREYDDEGNWTKELMLSWEQEKGVFEPSLVSRREITYFR
jgi:hypothetical protein